MVGAVVAAPVEGHHDEGDLASGVVVVDAGVGRHAHQPEVLLGELPPDEADLAAGATRAERVGVGEPEEVH